MEPPGPTIEQLQAELEKAEQKIARLRELAKSRKVRHERTQAELDRLRQTWPHQAFRGARRVLGLHELKTFCLFIGYTRSGHSLLGSLLDAHPDVAIARGTNVLKIVAAGGSDRPDLVETLVRQAAAEADRPGGRRASGYSYAVPGQWQGQVRTLRVVGVKAGERATLALGRDPTSLAKLRRATHLRVRLLHVTRNPFDMIARMALITKGGRPERTIAWATRYTARLARINARVIAARKDDVLTVRHETFVRDPRSALRRICEFLWIEPEEKWLTACASRVFVRPQYARNLVQWTADEREAVEQLIARRAFFHGYSWTSDG